MDDNQKKPLEIPDNNPQSSEKPIMGKNDRETKQQKRMTAVKLAYAFALLIAIGGALAAKIATENAIGELKIPIESDYITLNPTIPTTDSPDFEVRQNLENVPDTRNETAEYTTTTETPETTSKTETTDSESTSPYAIPFKDKFHSPTGGKVINKFENSKPIYNETLGEWRTHPGADYKSTEGEAIVAIAYGKVQNIYDDALYGTVIEIDHGNNIFARYCGLNKDTLEVKTGDSVKGKQPLGFLGSVPGESTLSPHLHLEVVYEEKLVDPEGLIN